MGNGPQFCKMGPGPAAGKVRQQKAPVAGRGWEVGNGQGGLASPYLQKHHLWVLALSL